MTIRGPYATSRKARQTTRGATSLERRCLACNMMRGLNTFRGGHSLCKQCRDNPPPKRAPEAPAVDEALERTIAETRASAGLPPRRAR